MLRVAFQARNTGGFTITEPLAAERRTRYTVLQYSRPALPLALRVGLIYHAANKSS